MDQPGGNGARDATVHALRAAVETGDLAGVERVLAADVQWFGSRSGACHDRRAVIDVLSHQFEHTTRRRLTDVRPVGDGLIVEAELAGDDDADPMRWIAALTVDAEGVITRIQDYEHATVAEHDLDVLARAATTGPRGGPPATPIAGLVPFVNVADVSRAVAFYELLGLQVRRSHEHDGRIVWAFLDSGTAALMVAGVEGPIDPRNQDVLFYLYTPDLAGLRDHLLGSGVPAGEILDGSPGPAQEMRVTDPDGYCLMIAQLDDESVGGSYSTALRAERADRG